MSSFILPFWFKQRQCKVEPQGGDHLLKVSGPNLGEAYLHVQQANGHWAAGLRLAPDGGDVAVTEPEFPTAQEAWTAAFELFRTHVIT